MSTNKMQLNNPIKLLTQKQENFCRSYFANYGNLLKSYIESYDSKSTNKRSLSQQAQILINNPLIIARITELKKLRNSIITIDPTTYVLSELLEQNETSINDLVDSETGAFIDLHKMDRNKAKAITKYKVTTTTDNEGNITKTVDIQLTSKLVVLDKIAKHINFYADHTTMKRKQGHSASRGVKEGPFEGSEITNNIQQNYINIPIEELEKRLKELKQA